MSKEEPAWKAELNAAIYRYFDQIGGGSIEFLTERFGVALAPHIHAAEQRGFQAGVNKTGGTVGKLREKLKALRAEVARQEALPVVQQDDGHADRFSVGARWSLRWLREILDAPDSQ